MKKNILNSLFVSVFSLGLLCVASATDFSGDLLSKPSRFFEIKIDSDTMAANNLFGLKDVLTKNVKVDLQEMVDNMSDDGFSLGAYNKESVFINMNFSSRFRFSIFTDVESSMRFNISKDLFDILGSGISIDDTKSIDIKSYGDVFYDMGFSLQTIIKDFGIKLTPTYFIPLVYLPKTTGNATMYMKSNGEISAQAYANVDVYTAVSMENYIDNDDSNKELDLDIAEILSNGGFDMSLELEKNWLECLNAGLYTRIPIIPGKLNYKMSTIAYADFLEKNLMEFITDKDKEKPEPKTGHVKPSTYNEEHENEEDGFEYSEETYKAYRPLKFGLNATYMPWGPWLKIQPSLGFAIRSPYTGEAMFYPEYALDIRLSVLKRIFNFNVGTAYRSQIFQHYFGFGLNFRVLEIVSQVSMCGTDFLSTFHTAGYGAFVGVRIGF